MAEIRAQRSPVCACVYPGARVSSSAAAQPLAAAIEGSRFGPHVGQFCRCHRNGRISRPR